MKHLLPKFFLLVSILFVLTFLFLPEKNTSSSPLVQSVDAQACRVNGEPCEIGTPNAANAKCCTGFTCNTDAGGIYGTCGGSSTPVDPSGLPSPVISKVTTPSQMIVGQKGSVVIQNCPLDGRLLCSRYDTPDATPSTRNELTCSTEGSGCTRSGDTLTCSFGGSSQGYWRARAECGTKVYTKPIYSSFSSPVFIASVPALKIDLASPIQWSTTKVASIFYLRKLTSGTNEYLVTINKRNEDVNSHFTIKIESNGTCKIEGLSNGAFTKDTTCIQSTTSPYLYNASVKIDTSKLSNPTGTTDASGQPFPAPYVEDSYTMTVNDPKGDVDSSKKAKKDFQVYNNLANKPKITIASKNTVTDPANADPDQWNKPKAEFNFFEGDATVEGTGCPVGTDMEFVWQRGDALDCNSTTCNLTDKDDDSHTEKVKSSGKASFNHSFSTDSKSDIYAMTAKCKQGGATTKVLFRAFGQGEEYVTLPITIAANAEWPVTIGGLDAKHHLCYYIRISKTNENYSNEDFNIPINANDITCGGENSIIDDDKKPIIMSRITENPSGSNTWGIENTVTIGGLESGYYKFYLYSANAKSKADWVTDKAKWSGLLAGPVFLPLAAGSAVTGWLMDKVTNTEGGDAAKAGSDNGIEFCVDVCRNDGQAFPPGKAPCLIGTDKEGNVVDARPESEQKDNPYKYTNKNGKKVTAQPGTRDDILTCTVVPTAFGNIDTSPQGIVKSLLQILLSIAGSVAFILILIAGYKIMTSRGNPEQIQDAKEQLTSAIVGLLFIIFSVVLLQTIGVDLLHIPGFKP